jgi:hypothetical protein
MKKTVSFDVLFRALIEAAPLHSNTSSTYQIFTKIGEEAVAACKLRESIPSPFTFGPFGEISVPYHTMGAVDTLDLFGLDELIIFSFYWANRAR